MLNDNDVKCIIEAVTDYDEKLDVIHSSPNFLDRTHNRVRRTLFTVRMTLNGEPQQANSRIEQIQALTNQRVALYRQTNGRFRHLLLLPTPSFHRDHDYSELNGWPGVSMDELQGDKA
jgi:hypothetical protein